MTIIGAILSRFISFRDEVKKVFTTLIVNIAMPGLIFSSLTSLPFDAHLLRQMLLVFLLSLFFHGMGMALGWTFSLPFGLRRQKQKELAVLSGLGNTGFIGIPLCALLFGPEGALLAAVYDAGLDVVLWSYVAAVLKRKEEAETKIRGRRNFKALLNAPLLAIIAGLLVAASGWTLPEVVGRTALTLGGMTVPLAMLYIGLMLAQLFRTKPRVQWKLLPLPAVVKLAICPIVAWGVIQLIPIAPVTACIVLLQSAMPTMTLASIIFAKYGADEELAAVVTILSTVLSVITLPLLLFLIL